ncbi:unnamed protein product [Gulo gulo]|uniref:Large ribosomal subunit protein uL23 N-terminal domain-containing protein n=1 Tax=Gulo gulo TaxID=48420 RepID=A0A9X9MA26_GULGU|nr:unnamed protein product [Gulo gulo]
MVPEAEKEAPTPTKAEAKGKALTAKKAVLKAIHSHKKKIHTSPTIPLTQDSASPKAAPIPQKEHLKHAQSLHHH